MKLRLLGIFIMVPFSALAENNVIASTDDSLQESLLYEHESCGVKHVVVLPDIDVLYINGQAAAIADASEAVGYLSGSKTGQQEFNPENGRDSINEYLDLVLKEHGLPRYDDLPLTTCVSKTDDYLS
jgi:hypothetical protein